MNYIHISITLLFVICCSLLSGKDQKPNVIFILTDDMGWGDLSSEGHPYLKTPNLDRIASEGTVFEQFYSQSAVCSPSRTAFVTSHFPQRHRVFGHFSTTEENKARGMPDFLDPEAVGLPNMMKAAGYRTIHIGKWHLAQVAPENFESIEGKPPRINIDDYGFDVFMDRFHFQDMLELVSNAVGSNDKNYYRAHSTGLYVQQAIRELQRNPEVPKFINLWTLVPHATLKPTPEELAVYDDLDSISPEDFPEPMRTYVADAENPLDQMKVYCAAMTGLDRQIGVLLESLEERGLMDNTILIFCSDNGPEDYHIRGAANAGMGSTNNLVGRKRSNHEGGVRTPLIVWWPGKVPAGKRNTGSVIAGVDLVPTLASLVDVPLPENLASDGEDVSDILLGADRKTTRPLYWETTYTMIGDPIHGSPRFAIRDGDWKFYMDLTGNRKELYNLIPDPSESNNLTDARPDVANSLEQKLESWNQSLPERPMDPLESK